MHTNKPDLSSHSIDLIYGLEPVFHPSAHALLESWAELQCPYCSEISGTVIDLTDESRSYIEDCPVCCQAMQVSLRVDADGRLLHASTRRLDE